MTSQNIISISVAIVALLISVFSVFRGFQSQATANQAEKIASLPSDMAEKTIKIAYIVPDSILKNYQYYQDISNQFDTKRNIAEREFEKKARNLQSEMQLFQQKAQAGLLSQNEIRSGEERLVKQERELQQYNQVETEKLMREEKELTERLYNRVADYIKKYNETAGYDFILNYVPGTTAWFVGESYNITQDIVDGLNQAYRDEKEGVKKP